MKPCEGHECKHRVILVLHDWGCSLASSAPSFIIQNSRFKVLGDLCYNIGIPASRTKCIFLHSLSIGQRTTERLQVW